MSSGCPGVTAAPLAMGGAPDVAPTATAGHSGGRWCALALLALAAVLHSTTGTAGFPVAPIANFSGGQHTAAFRRIPWMGLQRTATWFGAFPTKAPFHSAKGPLMSHQFTGAYQAYSIWGAASGASSRLAARLKKHRFVEKQVIPDGNCQFRALSDQLFDTEDHHRILRLRSVEWLHNNVKAELDESGLHWPDFLDTTEFQTPQRYCRHMERDGAWGDHFTLMGVAEVLDCNIQVISSVAVADEDAEQYITTIAPRLRAEKEDRRTLYLSHHAERHYNSLRREGEL